MRLHRLLGPSQRTLEREARAHRHHFTACTDPAEAGYVACTLPGCEGWLLLAKHVPAALEHGATCDLTVVALLSEGKEG